jgi:Holliday junction resolvase RusA-like endonuclease
MSVTFTVPGEPVAKARARVFFNKRADRVMAITPTKTATFEQYVKLIAADYFTTPFLCPLVMTVTVFKGTPKSLSKKLKVQAEEGILRPTTKPDCSNFLKSVEDALNGIAYRDDSQLVSVHVHKFYSDTPRTVVCIEGLAEVDQK